jgi:hypothetical protein
MATPGLADEAPSARERHSRRAPLRALGPVTVALVALVSSAVALAFTLFPGLAPDPGTTFRAHVAVFAVERDVAYGDYLHRIAPSPAHYRQELAGATAGMNPMSRRLELALGGDVAYVESTLEGFKHGDVVLRWSLYHARSGERVRDPQFDDQPGAQVDVDAPTDRTMQLVWFRPPPGDYFVRVGLYDKSDTLLDVADSRHFVVPQR